MNLVINILYPLITIIVSTFFIYGVKLYITTKNINYIIASIIDVIFLIYLIYKMYIINYSILIIGLCVKIFPMICIVLLDFIVLKEPLTILKLIGIFLVILGSFFII